MRYIYIICLTLSSLFAYKYAAMATELQQYAFFMPNNAFEGNTSVQNIENMHPRYNKPRYQKTYKDEEDDDYYYDRPNKSTAPKTAHTKKTTAEPKVTLPYVKKDIHIVKPEKNKQVAAPIAKSQPVAKKTSEPKKAPELTEAIQKKLQQYSLDEPKPTNEATSVIKTDSIAQQETKTISKMLEAIPYPNRTLPKFQQLYSIYGTELRVLYRRGELPKNKEQEDTLAKANSFRRFVVE